MSSNMGIWELKDKNDNVIPLKSIKIEGRIKDHTCSYTIAQTFRNTCRECIESIYTFPVGWSCVVTGFAAIIKDKRLNAQTFRKKTTAKKYERAIDTGNLPIMLETSQEGIATVSLGNLKSDEEVTLEISFFTLLLPQDGSIRITIPLNLGKRYSADGRPGKLQPYEQVTTDFYAEYKATARFHIEGVLASTSVSVPTHSFLTSFKDKDLIVIVNNAFADRNLVLAFDDVKALNKGYMVQDPFNEDKWLSCLATTIKSTQNSEVASLQCIFSLIAQHPWLM